MQNTNNFKYGDIGIINLKQFSHYNDVMHWQDRDIENKMRILEKRIEIKDCYCKYYCYSNEDAEIIVYDSDDYICYSNEISTDFLKEILKR